MVNGGPGSHMGGDRTGPPVSLDPWITLPPTELVATIANRPAPDIPLASIRHALMPVHDAAGRVTDWQLDASRYDDRDAISAYRIWRRSWRLDVPIGNLGNLTTLGEELAKLEPDNPPNSGLLDVITFLTRAESPTMTVSADRAPQLLEELETVRLALSVDERFGIGVIDDMPATSRSIGLARAWAPPTTETLLCRTTTTTVLVRPDSGMSVLHSGPPVEVFTDITGVDMRAETAVLINRRGMSLRLTQEQARPLAWLVPRSLRWHLRPIPLVSVWSDTFDGLREALRAAMASGDDLVITGELSIT
jgi:hypothetical protein